MRWQANVWVRGHGASFEDALGVNTFGLFLHAKQSPSYFAEFLRAQPVPNQAVGMTELLSASSWEEALMDTHEHRFEYAIGDYMESSSNPWVITGSHNWTASAESTNDENTLIIYDHEIANWYYQEYTQRVMDNSTGLEEELGVEISLFPNPTNDALTLNVKSSGIWKVIDALGATVLDGRAQSGANALEMSGLAAGTYVLQVISEGQVGSSVFVRN